jgi:hypothetical protein
MDKIQLPGRQASGCKLAMSPLPARRIVKGSVTSLPHRLAPHRRRVIVTNLKLYKPPQAV